VCARNATDGVLAGVSADTDSAPGRVSARTRQMLTAARTCPAASARKGAAGETDMSAPPAGLLAMDRADSRAWLAACAEG